MKNSYETPEVIELGSTEKLILGALKIPVGWWDSVIDPLSYWVDDEDDG